tara:strand:- start:23180 stop:25903 length:2724 start_codon:yes stop_codon:yes gene_type:complete
MKQYLIIIRKNVTFQKTKAVYLILLVFLLLGNSSFSQSVKLKGRVLDSLQNPLSYANIIAESTGEQEVQFSITDEKGRYELNLKKSKTYKLIVSYLGFKTKVLDFLAIQDTIYNFILVERNEVLKEIKIDTKLAVSIKKDTITYQTDRFITGEERKLRDVLKKLPGVEVDRAGNVRVHGKRVTKVLVEDKQFFTGDSKLAVNNIPADAVSEIEILDNYADVAILKGLEDSDDMAMNIKLKEGKKKFWFGDIETGAGITERYLAHPNLFYYSPKTSTNFIGDINNTGTKSFTFKDYLDFEGGYNKILLNPKAYFSRLNDDFSQFLNNKDFKNSIHSFLAANINQTVSDHANLIGYVIYSNSDNELELRNINEYVSDTGSQFENRITNNNTTNRFIIGKVAVENVQEDGTTLKIESFLKASNNENLILTNSSFDNANNFINTDLQSDNIDFKQNIEWYKSVSEKHTITAIGNINYIKGNSLVNWQTSDDVFQSIIPIVDDSVFNISKDKETTSQNLSLLLKDYWILGDFVHLYTTGGVECYLDNYTSIEFQTLTDGSINDFIVDGFGNDIEFQFKNTYIGSHLKFQKGKFTFKPGVFYHNYSRKLVQFNEVQRLHKNYILPELLVKIDLKRSEKINIRYNLKARFPSITRLLENQTLTNFNSIYKGNTTLENELYHQASIRYYKFSIFKKLNYNVSVNYRKTSQGIRNTAVLNDISYISQPTLLKNADENINFSGSIRKGFGDISLQIGGSASFSNYLQIVNSNILKNTSENYGINTSLKTSFTNFPNIELSYRKSFDNYKTPLSNSKFENDNVDLFLEYDFWKDFIFRLDYRGQKFNNKNVNNQNQNDILNTSLFYQLENSPWSFEVSANNLFNNTFIRNSSFSDFLISDSRTFILPRIILFKLAYKL